MFFENLDGLRTFCFLAVFFHHSFVTNEVSIYSTWYYKLVKNFLVANGNLGVNCFFVLSGFLITYLLLEELDHFGSLSLRAFYVRRFLRIWPLFYLCVAFGFLVFPLLKTAAGQIPNETADWRMYLVYLNNFDLLYSGLPDCSSLTVLWSVAIEEQFYLVWPVLLILLPRRFYTAGLLAILVGSFLFRLRYWHSADHLDLHTLSCISDMTVGGLLAHLVRSGDSLKRRIEEAPRGFWIIVYVVGILAALFRQLLFEWHPLAWATDRLFFSLLFGTVILEQTYAKNSFYKMNRFRTMSKLGKYTYGLYCLHMIGILCSAVLLQKLGLNKHSFQVLLLEPVLALGLSLLFAYASYQYYEKPFLRLKSKFAKVVKA